MTACIEKWMMDTQHHVTSVCIGINPYVIDVLKCIPTDMYTDVISVQRLHS